MFREIESDSFSPGAIVSMFEEEEQQREVAKLFNTKIEMITTPEEKEKAFHDILVRVKEHSLDYHSVNSGTDVADLAQVISGKRVLEILKKTHISFRQ